jgi:REP element-mobilizing transposase RayT
MNRVADGASWLKSPAEASAFLSLAAEPRAEFPMDLHAYCLLPGHYHLLVRAEPGPLLASLLRLESKAGFAGGAAPRAIPVAFGRHLTSVSRYIHLNPVDAGLVWCPEHWPYSSFGAYLGDVDAPAWVVTEAVLGRFGTIGARHRHRAYVYAGMDPQTRDRDGRPRWSSLYRRGSLAEDLAWRIEPTLASYPSGSQTPHTVSTGVTLHQLARAVAGVFDVPIEVLRSARAKGRAATLARGAFVHAARGQGTHRLRDVAFFAGYSSSAMAAAAAERFDRARRIDPRLASQLLRVESSARSRS